MEKFIYNICYAQIASDGGKNIATNKKFNEKIFNNGYSIKDDFIIEAIKEIDKLNHTNKYCNGHYYVSYEHCFANYTMRMYIVYFNFKYNEKKYQVSFHMPVKMCSDIDNFLYKKYRKSSQRISWRKNQVSRNNVLEILSLK